MLNKVTLIGRLGGDPEVKNLENGTTVCSMTLASSEKWTDKSGQKQERTEWHRLSVWGKLAEICQQYCFKGQLIYVEGKIQTRKWQDKETGKDRFSTEINVQEMRMLGGKKEAQAGHDHAGAFQEPAFSDDIPF